MAAARIVLLALGLVFLPYSIDLARFSNDPILYYAFIVFLFDLPLVLLALIVLPGYVRGVVAGRGPVAMLWLAFIALLLLAFVVHPSASGAQTLIRILVGLAIAVAILTLDLPQERSIVVGSLVIAAFGQAILMSVQAVHMDTIGLTALGEYPDPLPTRDGEVIPKGTMGHGYVATGLALLASGLAVERAAASSRPLPWLVAVAVAAIPIGLTFSRAALLGLGVGALWLLWEALRGRRVYALAVLALALGFGTPALLRLDGWVSMGTETLQGDPQRVSLMGLALDLIREEPLFGVGPGRYMTVLRTNDVPLQRPVHNVPLLITAEAGLAAGALVTALLVIGGARAVGARGVAPAIFAFFVPFVLFDHYAYTQAQGVPLAGIWIGALALEHGSADRV